MDKMKVAQTKNVAINIVAVAFVTLLLFGLLACASGNQPGNPNSLAGTYISVAVDNERGVTCYYFSNAMDCIANSELKN